MWEGANSTAHRCAVRAKPRSRRVFHMLARLVLLAAHALIIAAGAGPSAVGPTASAWCGVFNYKGFATNAPLNISILGSTASINTVWDRKAHGCHQCCAETEDSLKVSRTGTRITFLGNGSAQDFCECLGASAVCLSAQLCLSLTFAAQQSAILNTRIYGDLPVTCRYIRRPHQRCW